MIIRLKLLLITLLTLSLYLAHDINAQDYICFIEKSQKTKETSDVQTKYETDKKESLIQQQRQILIFLSTLCVLAIVTISLIIRWKRTLLLLSHKQKKIVELQKAEARLQMQGLKETKTIKKERDELVDKVTTLVKENLLAYPEERDKYLERLQRIDKDSLFILKKRNISDLRIQYCICFGIGMKKEHVSLCYNITDHAIRKHKSNIKRDLGLEKDDNLDSYLFELFFNQQ